MKTIPDMLYTDDKGRVFDDPLYHMGAFDGKELKVPKADDLVLLPKFSKLFMIPGCAPVGKNRKTGRFETAEYLQGSHAVSAFMKPGFVRLYHPAFDASKKASFLPLWAYNAIGFRRGRYYAPAVLVDDNNRWQAENYDDRKIPSRIRSFQKKYPKNRLVEHLSRCAVDYHCFAAKNLFLGRWEAPLPVSRGCNARCLGCISLQESEHFPASHDRIAFKPTPKEIAEIAVAHLERADDGIVSFGQGCEGEPLSEAELIAKAIKAIRKETRKGVIHLNTNGYSAEKLKELIDSGLDSVRISLSSARENLYNAYYRPVNYSFSDVVEAIKTCSLKGIYTTINYLVFPGVTDEDAEWDSFKNILLKTKPHFVHLKNLNIDPVFYLQRMKAASVSSATPQKGSCNGKLLGMKKVISLLRKEFPEIKLGYFNRTRKEIDEHLGEQKTENREQKTENREQKTENREQKTENREQKTENREQKTENREQKTEDREQKTENREQKTENREQKTEDREQKTEDRLK